MRPVKSLNDPAPSRLSYRMQRLMLTPLFRRLLRVGLPFGISFAAASFWLSDPDVQQKVVTTALDLRQQIEERPEFMVRLLEVEGASDNVAADIRNVFPMPLPASSFDLDLDQIRRTIEDLPAVASAAVHLRQGGVLELRVTEREPVAILRTRKGLSLIDIEGVSIAEVDRLADFMSMPLITGEGARKHVAEALALDAAAGPLQGRMLGLVRMGERRWDVVLDRDQRILLPEAAPVRALERVIVLDETQDMLERDIAVVDMRLAERPAIRMRERAVDAWWQVRNSSAGVETE
ncbi:cell division protein FtsQ/DivIB [Roseovarius sp. SCSIO 43702]|uniref:cell division protein FtsQ/DivIB n=1 Tax=Roseovarius sp. SCSIO 43702 TaxID=2823043 RepID=UPI001C7350AC|nr:cell division protein FtsQ/DivIB [Roseovarius sp. SCSIO 43702]QYX55893.1 cell division protein FtsQ/DivIB [Roseovarius sp. SCSIO 43702]